MNRQTRSLGALLMVPLFVAAGAGPAAATVPLPPLPPAVSTPTVTTPPPPAVSTPAGGPVPAVNDPSAPALPAVGQVGVVGANSQSAVRSQASGGPMTGQFVVSDGRCGSGATPVGSYFSMLDPLGNPVANGDSPCSDKSATPVAAGADGLLPGRMQPFAGSPGATRAIVAPTTFFGSPFAVATQGPDKQSGAAVQAPSIQESGGKLSGQISAFQAFYNGAYYNQGAPKPGGGTPGRTTAGVSGTYNADTGAFVLEWRSTITGGAFNSFTGVWHLEGTYKAAAGGASAGTSTPDSAGTSGSPSSGTGSSATSSGTSSGVTAAGPQGGDPQLADTGIGAAGAGGAALGLCAMTLALWWRRVGWSN